MLKQKLKLKGIVSVLLLLCLMIALTSCGPAGSLSDNVGTVDLETLEFAEYTEIEPVLSGAWLETPEGVCPYEAVWHGADLYFLGKTHDRQGLYAMKASESGEILPAGSL